VGQHQHHHQQQLYLLFFCAFLLSIFLPFGCDLDDFLSSCSNIFNNFFFSLVAFLNSPTLGGNTVALPAK